MTFPPAVRPLPPGSRDRVVAPADVVADVPFTFTVTGSTSAGRPATGRVTVVVTMKAAGFRWTYGANDAHQFDA